MTFCDLAMLYCPTGGGIRTYCDAKLDWFRRQTRHRYVLIVPGERSAISQVTPWATVIEARGVCVTRASDSYRLFCDFSYIRSVIRQYQPDVLEAGDSWLSGPLARWASPRHRGPAIVSSCFHTDPIPTYVDPFVNRWIPGRLACSVSNIASRAFYRLQRSYDMTIASSAGTAERLTRAGIRNVCHVPFGADPIFFRTGEGHRWTHRPQRRLLYAGRLDRDKHVDRLIAILPRLLEAPNVFVTIAGTGTFRSTFERWNHPRLRFIGYVRERETLAGLYGDHDVFLAPGPHETFGLAALEAMAAGLVVVGPNQGGIGSLLREMRSPFMFTAGDAGGFLAATRAAVAADGAAASAASRSLAGRYATWPEAINRLVDTYRRVFDDVTCANGSSFCRCTT